MNISEYSNKELLEEVKHRKLEIRIIDWFPKSLFQPTKITIDGIPFDIR